jgi:DNA primase
MNVNKLKEILIGDYSKIESILEKLGCGKINFIRSMTEIRCAIDDEPDSNGNSIRVKTDTLWVTSFSDRLSLSGDIISLVIEMQQCKFNEAIKFICSATGIEYDGHDITPEKTPPLFGGYFKGIKQTYDITDIDVKTYKEDILDEFLIMPSRLFLDDGISRETQREFNIGYDYQSQRILLPWRTPVGEIAGATGRWNGEDFEEYEEPKYKPVFPVVGFSKSLLLYGYSENYKSIQQTGMVIIGESEKATMKLHSMGYANGVSIGSHNMSEVQVQLIKSLFPKFIILALDEDIEESFLIEECKRLQFENAFVKSKVGYIFDDTNTYLEKGSKKSPADLPVDKFEALMEEKIKWIN